MTHDPFLAVKDLTRDFAIKAQGRLSGWTRLRAVDHVSLQVERGQTLGLVGESGCGKSTLGQMVAGLLPPTRGEVYLQGRPLWGSQGFRQPDIRRAIQMVFQDPSSSLNPRMRIGRIIGEGLAIHRMGTRSQKKKRVAQLMEMTGILPQHAGRYPHEFSGGQRQRISIARALSLEPEIIVCDEPVSALDVSIQAQIVNLLLALQQELGLTYIFISHDLAVVRKICHCTAVMYLGGIVEVAYGNDLYENPCHPYTKALLAAVPRPDPLRTVPDHVLEGELPSPLAPPSGCVFHPRCPVAEDECSRTIPSEVEVEPGHRVRCLRAGAFCI